MGASESGPKRPSDLPEEAEAAQAKRARREVCSEGKSWEHDPLEGDTAPACELPLASLPASGSTDLVLAEALPVLRDDGIRSHVAGLLGPARDQVRSHLVNAKDLLALQGEELKKAVRDRDALQKAAEAQEATVRQHEETAQQLLTALTDIQKQMQDTKQQLNEKEQEFLNFCRSAGIGMSNAQQMLEEVRSAEDAGATKEGSIKEYAELYIQCKQLEAQELQAESDKKAHETVLADAMMPAKTIRQNAEHAEARVKQLEGQLAQQKTRKSAAEEEFAAMGQQQEHLVQVADDFFGPRGALPRSCASQFPSNLTLAAMIADAIQKHVPAQQLQQPQQPQPPTPPRRTENPPAVAEALGHAQRDEPMDPTVFSHLLVKADEELNALRMKGLKRLVAEGCLIEEILKAGFTHGQVASAVCGPLASFPQAGTGSVVTYIFSGPDLQKIRKQGKCECMASPELQWDTIAVPVLRYWFQLILFPNGEPPSAKSGEAAVGRGNVGLYWKLCAGPSPEHLLWPLPHKRCSVALRVLSPTAKKEKDFSNASGFAKFVEDRAPPTSTAAHGLGIGWGDFLSQDEASTFFLGCEKDALVVQCELRVSEGK
mmetsp:Transcript_13096/g.30590  ORF Transcript_13096/g.30590 Transcript_13096/m.30590 type:complete len:600 (-) Transcript_13096:114-1913(-)